MGCPNLYMLIEQEVDFKVYGPMLGLDEQPRQEAEDPAQPRHFMEPIRLGHVGKLDIDYFIKAWAKDARDSVDWKSMLVLRCPWSWYEIRWMIALDFCFSVVENYPARYLILDDTGRVFLNILDSDSLVVDLSLKKYFELLGTSRSIQYKDMSKWIPVSGIQP